MLDAELHLSKEIFLIAPNRAEFAKQVCKAVLIETA